MADIQRLLQYLLEHRGSDLHVKAGSAPALRIDGHLRSSQLPSMTATETHELAMSVMPPLRATEFEEAGETDFAIGISGLGRFRVSALRQRGSTAMVVRRVLTAPPTFDDLGLPAPVRQLAERRSGLVLVTGPASSGKTTTIATMIDHINSHRPASIITIEDPIEMLHPDKRSFVSQREVGTDTKDHATALRRSLRHDPDVIAVDRIPDAEVMSLLLSAASGRLVLSTLPSLTATEAIAHVVDFSTPQQANQARHVLASTLAGVVSQRLIEREDGRGRVAAFEMLVATPRVHDSIVETPGVEPIEQLIANGEYYGMQTMDQHLEILHRNRLISLREALSAATHPQELRVKLQ